MDETTECSTCPPYDPNERARIAQDRRMLREFVELSRQLGDELGRQIHQEHLQSASDPEPLTED